MKRENPQVALRIHRHSRHFGVLHGSSYTGTHTARARGTLAPTPPRTPPRTRTQTRTHAHTQVQASPRTRPICALILPPPSLS